MKKVFAWLMLLTATALFAMSVTPALAHTNSDPLWKPLYAGSPHYYDEPGPKDPSWYFDHRMEVGGLRVWNDGDNLYVDYYTWEVGMRETHLAVAIEPSVDVNGDGEINILDADIPQTKSGNPKVGKFPYKYEDLGGAMLVMYTISLGDWEVDDTLIIAAHAALCDGETAWADCGGADAYFVGNNWATFFTYTVQ